MRGLCGLCGLLCHGLCIKSCCDVCEAGISRDTGSQSEPINCVLIGTVTEGFTVPETVITK